MSKIDDQRAVREARLARQRASGTGTWAKRPATPAPVAPVAPVALTRARAEAAPAKAPDAEGAEAAPELCGHRNMSGRTCTREHGHAAKSHRYG